MRVMSNELQAVILSGLVPFKFLNEARSPVTLSSLPDTDVQRAPALARSIYPWRSASYEMFTVWNVWNVGLYRVFTFHEPDEYLQS